MKHFIERGDDAMCGSILKLIRNGSLMTGKYFSMLLGGTLTMMVVSALLMSDSIIAGLVLGEDAVAGITLITPLYFIAAFFGSIFSLGVPIIYSARVGKFRKKEADQAMGIGLLMAVVIGVLLFAGSCLFGDAYLHSCHASPEVFDYARSYLFWMRGTFLLMPLQMLMVAMVYADGDEKISTAASIVQGVGNLAASLVLSFFMGAYGISLASFLFNLISLIVLFFHLKSARNTLRLSFYFSVRLLLRVLRYSIIDASSYLFLGVLNALLNWFISVQCGSEFLILVSVVNLCREFQLIFDGIGEAITPILSIYLGEECFAGVKRVYGLAKVTSIFEGLLLTAVMLLLAPVVPHILGIADPVTAGYAVAGVRIMAVSSTFVSLLYLSTSYDLLVGRILIGLIIGAMRDALVAVPLSAVLIQHYGTDGFFAALSLAPVLAWMLSIIWLRIRYRDDVPLFLKNRSAGKTSLIYDLPAEPDAIIRVRDAVGEDLKALCYDKKSINRTMVMIEELFMLIREHNQDTKVTCECSLLLEEHTIRIIAKDTGEAFDLSDPDLAVSSLRCYVLSNLAQQVSANKQHLAAMSFNRNVFEIKAARIESTK